MPVYEYACKKCGQRMEIIQKMSDSPLTTCTTCQGDIYRIISPSGLSFKGGGWYVTDYAKKDKGSEQAGKTVDSKAGDKPGDKKEAAPAPATASSGDKKESPPAASPSPPPKTKE